MVVLGIIAAVTIFLLLKNKQENRMIDRRNKLAEKQEALLEKLKKQDEENKNNL